MRGAKSVRPLGFMTDCGEERPGDVRASQSVLLPPRAAAPSCAGLSGGRLRGEAARLGEVERDGERGPPMARPDAGEEVAGARGYGVAPTRVGDVGGRRARANDARI